MSAASWIFSSLTRTTHNLNIEHNICCGFLIFAIPRGDWMVTA